MSLFARVLLSLSVVLLTVPANALPSFDIDLDTPPEKRWVKVVAHYRSDMIAMGKALGPLLAQHLGKEWESWLQVAHFDPEYEAELQGIVDAVNDSSSTLNSAKLTTLLYEIGSPTACSAALWAMRNGTVMQGRNMDYAFHFKLPGGSLMNWNNVTFDVTFHKAGKPLYKTTSWPGLIGVHTGMRFGGWSIQQNSRSALNDWHENLKVAKQGGQTFPPETLVVRKVMDTVPHFKDAVAKINATKFMAPMYFIMSGTGPFEGAVLTIDRMANHTSSTPPVVKVSNTSTGWHLVQTNDDLGANLSQPSLDPRRPIANYMLSGATQDIISVEHLMQFMHSSPLKNFQTVFSTVMVPAKDYFKTTLPDEPPGPIARDLFAKGPSSPASVATTRSLRGSGQSQLKNIASHA